MKIVIAPDSFKESLPAAEVAAAIEAGLREVWPQAEYILIPMADGGEGTVNAVIAATGGTIRTATVTGPMGAPLIAAYGVTPVTPDGSIAILEMASASGLEHVPLAQRNPLQATSYGTGELILHALKEGDALQSPITRCILGIGGSATVDGGAGMLQALGAHLLNSGGRPIGRGGAALAELAHIDLSGIDPRLRLCRIEAACDVDNPLTGPDGAAATFGPQKGATPAMVVELEANLQNLARVLASDLGVDVAAIPGAGAAGGMGAALVACLNAILRPGVQLIADLLHLEDAIRTADLVLTGEGRIDAQTIHGKTPVGVAAIARRHNKPVFALAGSLGPGADAVLSHGIDAIFSIQQSISTRKQAFASTTANLRITARNIAAVWEAAKRAT